MIIVNNLDVTKCPEVREGMIYAICGRYQKLCYEIPDCRYKRTIKDETNSRNTET